MSDGTSDQPSRASDVEPLDEVSLRVVPAADGVVAVIGELDLGSASALLTALRATEARRVDLSGVTFIDVAGLRALVSVDGLHVTRSCAVVDRIARLCAQQGWPTISGLADGAEMEPDDPTGIRGAIRPASAVGADGPAGVGPQGPA